MTSDSADSFDVETYLAVLSAAGRSKATLFNYRHSLDLFGTWFGRPLVECQRLDALRYVEHMRQRLRPASVAHHVRSLRAFYGWCVTEDLAATNPFAKMRLSIPAEAKPTPTTDDVAAMLDSARGDKRAHALLCVLVATGCRRGELAGVTPADVDLQSGTIRFTQSKSRARTVPLDDRAVASVARWWRRRGGMQRHPNFWNTDDGGQLIRRVVTRHSKGTMSPHDLRRFFACQWLSCGGSESSLIRLCGWRDGSMVRVYTAARADVLALDEYRRLMASTGA